MTLLMNDEKKSALDSTFQREDIITIDGSTPFVAASLTVSNINYEITVKDKSSGGKMSFLKRPPNIQKQILSDISIRASPGHVLAIMGPSGSGKTSLLDLIGNRQDRNVGKLTGDILLNDIPIKECDGIRKRLFGYVTQEDYFIDCMTVLETLTFAAKLKLPRSMSDEDKLARVYQVMQELQLTHIKDTKVGGFNIRGISGGERRRVTIGIELLSSPSILLLDEPTSGLSSTDALNVVNTIKKLARKGHTVILTVHQPRSDIFTLFDDLLLLSQGKTVYFGSAHSASLYFENLGYDCPAGWNIADYLLDLITINQETGLSDSGTDFAECYSGFVATNPEALWTKMKDEYQVPSDKSERDAVLEKIRSAYSTKYAATTLTQTTLIIRRSFSNIIRNPLVFQASLFIHVIFAVILGNLFSRVKNPDIEGGEFSRSVALYFICAFLTIMAFMSLPSLINEKQLFFRERSAGMYRTSAYFYAKTVVDTIAYSIQCTLFILIMYYMLELKGSVFYYILVTAAFENVLLSVVADIGAAAKDVELGIGIYALVNMTALLFQGFVVTRPNIPNGWIWLYWVSYNQWYFMGLIENEFNDSNPKNIGVLSYYGINQIDWYSKWISVYFLLGYIVLSRLSAFLILHFKKT